MGWEENGMEEQNMNIDWQGQEGRLGAKHQVLAIGYMKQPDDVGRVWGVKPTSCVLNLCPPG